MINAAVYIRVSTDDQLEYSPDAQRKDMLAYAERNNMLVLPDYIFIDEGLSGRRADKRPAFQKMIAAAKTKPKPFNVILVHKFDRFARSREDSVVYKSMLLRECGVKVISIKEDISDDKTSVILEAMLEAMAEYYSLNLADEVKKGMTEKAYRGEIQTVPAFGYSVENGKLEVIEEEAEIVRLIFRNFLLSESIVSIARKINAMGIRTHRGNLFDSRGVEYILNNPVYTGKLRWNPSEKTLRNYFHPNLLIVQSTHTPIISDSDFELAQKLFVLRKEKKRARPSSEMKHFLSGLVKCGACGSTLVYSHANKGFQCHKYAKGLCGVSHFINAPKLENLVCEVINQDAVTGIGQVEIINIQQLVRQEDVEYINNQLSRTEVKIKRINDAYLEGVYSLDDFKRFKQTVQKEISELENQKAKLANEKTAVKTKEAVQEIASKATAMFNSSLLIQEKKEIADSTLRNIVYSKSSQKVIISYKFIIS